MWQKWKMWQKCGIKVKNVANALKMWQFGNPDIKITKDRKLFQKP